MTVLQEMLSYHFMGASFCDWQVGCSVCLTSGCYIGT